MAGLYIPFFAMKTKHESWQFILNLIEKKRTDIIYNIEDEYLINSKVAPL